MRELVAFIFIIAGIWTLIDPKGAVGFKVNLLKAIGVRMKLNIDAKSYKALRFVGLAIAIIGFLMI